MAQVSKLKNRTTQANLTLKPVAGPEVLYSLHPTFRIIANISFFVLIVHSLAGNQEIFVNAHESYVRQPQHDLT
jgi:hypothetical protein